MKNLYLTLACAAATALLVTPMDATARSARVNFNDPRPASVAPAATLPDFSVRAPRLKAPSDDSKPLPPTNVRIVETATPGEVTITWDAPTRDSDGDALDPAGLTYIIQQNTGSGWRILDKISFKPATSVTFQALKSGQDIVQFSVNTMASGYGLVSDDARTRAIAIGTPYTLPYAESFANTETSHVHGITRVRGNGSWYLAADNTFSDGASQDGDNGFAYFESANQYDEADMFSGKIAVTGTAPVLSLYYQTMGEKDINELNVNIDDGTGEVELISIPQQGEEGQWRRAMVSLASYIGKTVQLHFHAVANFFVYTFMDNITIGESVPTSLSLTAFSAPESVNAGTDISLPVTILNAGNRAAEGYQLTVYRNDEPLDLNVELPRIEPFGEVVINVTDRRGVRETGTYTYRAEISWDKDDDATDNQSVSKTVEVVATEYPGIELTGAQGDDNTAPTLSWIAPDLGEQDATLVTESFESPEYESFTTKSFGLWTLYNYNESDTWPYDSKKWTFPGIKTPFGFILMDAATAGLPAECSGYNGSPDPDSGSGRCLQAFAHKDDANNAWLISPKLSGEAQTIKFMARSLDPDSYNPEQFIAYYSAGSTDPDFFSPIAFTGGPAEGAPLEWTEYTFALPEGAERFAIRSYSEARYVLLLDDFTFTGYMNPLADLRITGYNIYRDDVKVAQAPADATSWTDTESIPGNHVYTASVAYNLGESGLSDELNLATSGISGVDATPATRISAQAGAIVIKNAAGCPVSVTSIDGRTVAEATDRDSMTIAVGPGIYIVRAGTTTAKVIVK